MKRPILALDIDGVLCDSIGDILSSISDVTHGRYFPEPPTRHELELCYPWLTPEIISKALRKLDWFNCSVMPLAAELNEYLYPEYNIQIITTRPRHSYELTLAWLEKNRINYHGIHFVEPRTKHMLDCNVAVDDDLEQSTLYSQSGKLCYLFDRPWNRHEKTRLRVSGWHELAGQLLEIVND